MRYFDSNKINRGKRLIDIEIAIIIFINLFGLVVELMEKSNISKRDITLTIIIFTIIIFYYKGNKIAFKIISSIVPIMGFTILALLSFSVLMYLLKPFHLGLGGILILFIVYCGVAAFLCFRLDWFECIKEYKLYRNENEAN